MKTNLKLGDIIYEIAINIYIVTVLPLYVLNSALKRTTKFYCSNFNNKINK